MTELDKEFLNLYQQFESWARDSYATDSDFILEDIRIEQVSSDVRWFLLSLMALHFTTKVIKYAFSDYRTFSALPLAH